MGKPIKVEYLGITYPSEKSLCDSLNLNYNTYKNRRRRGWSQDECIIGERKVEKPYINTQSYNNTIIRSTDELLNLIKSFLDIDKINLIDYENVCDNKMLSNNHIKDENVINIFFFNACIYSNNYYSLIKDSKSINIQITSTEAANQLIDHTLIFYLGVLISRFPTKQYRIYSKDTGYLPFITNLNYSNIKMAKLGKSSSKHGYKYALAKYILSHPDIRASKYYTKGDFRGLFKSFSPGKKYNARTLSNLINELIRFQFIEMVKVDERYYRFCLNKIEEYVSKINKEG